MAATGWRAEKASRPECASVQPPGPSPWAHGPAHHCHPPSGTQNRAKMYLMFHIFIFALWTLWGAQVVSNWGSGWWSPLACWCWQGAAGGSGQHPCQSLNNLGSLGLAAQGLVLLNFGYPQGCFPWPPHCGLPWAYSSPPMSSSRGPFCPAPLLPSPQNPHCVTSGGPLGSLLHKMLSQSILALRDNLVHRSLQTSCRVCMKYFGWT